jgi:DNA-binding NarL/FixJ family response regulator
MPPDPRHAIVSASITKHAFLQRWTDGLMNIDTTTRGLIAQESRIPLGKELLSSREFDVLQLMSRGLTNKVIARNLHIAPETVKSHAKKIFGKLQARTRTEAVARVSGWNPI